MERRYTRCMPARQPPLPLIWLLSDARNDASLEDVLARLPPRSGFVFRHYHLAAEARSARFRILAAHARGAGHAVVLADGAALAREWGADGVYGDSARIAAGGADLLRLATAHDGAELSAAAEAGARGVFLSPVFPSRSHPESETLGIHGFHVLAQRSAVPVIALGGMTNARAAELAWPRWAAIDGLASPHAA
jgi:thiamine-phosphate pyrophosphorylase